MKKVLVSAVLISLLTSCATYKSGKTQQIRITSTPQGADCSVANKTSSTSVRTPGVAEVSRSMSSLNVSCQAPGYGAGETQVKYGVNWWSAGNIALLGFPYLYDMYTGAVAEYPESVEVQLKPMAQTYQGNFQMRDYNSNAVVPNGLAQPSQYQQYQQQQAPQQGVQSQNPYVQQYQQQMMMQQQQQYAPQGYGNYPAQPQNPYAQPQQVQQPQTQEQIIQEMMQERKQVTGGGQQQQ